MSLSLGPMKAGRHINLTGDYSWRQNKRVEKGFGGCPFMEAISRTRHMAAKWLSSTYFRMMSRILH
jgi:hypothetical protein